MSKKLYLDLQISLLMNITTSLPSLSLHPRNNTLVRNPHNLSKITNNYSQTEHRRNINYIPTKSSQTNGKKMSKERFTNSYSKQSTEETSKNETSFKCS